MNNSVMMFVLYHYIFKSLYPNNVKMQCAHYSKKMSILNHCLLNTSDVARDLR